MFDFRKIAQNQTSASPLHAGREQLDTNEVIGDVLTIEEFSKAFITEKGVVKDFGVVTFKERPGYYYNTGTAFSNIIDAWIAGFGEFDDDIWDRIDEANAAYQASGDEIKVRFTETRTKTGNNFTKVDIL